jgi:hypothetical protein
MAPGGAGAQRVNPASHGPPRRARRAAWVAVILLLCLCPALAQLSRGLKTRSFLFPQYYEDLVTGRGQTNLLKGVLKGAEGQYLTNDIIQITRMQLEHYELDGRTNLTAQAPHCFFDPQAQVAWSTSRLDVIGMEGALLIHGYAGFEVRMTNSTMFLSNRVRTTIRSELLKTSRP